MGGKLPNNSNSSSIPTLMQMIPVFEWYFYPEYAAKGIIKPVSIENIKF